jgi:hypothetical protein
LTRYLLRKRKFVQSDGYIRVILATMMVSIVILFCLFVTGAIVPALVGYTSAWGVLGGATMLGVAFGAADLVHAYYFPEGE